MGCSPESVENPVASRPLDRRRRQSPPDPRPTPQKHACSSLEGCLSCPSNGTATPIERDKSANSSEKDKEKASCAAPCGSEPVARSEGPLTVVDPLDPDRSSH